MKAENIKFKAKRLDGKGWTIGDLLHSYENGVIIVPIEGGGAFSVDPDTICQFIGLKDCEGNELYEHDVIKNYPFIPSEIVWSEEAYRITGIASTHIRECCRGLRKTSGGYCWKFKNE